MKSTQSIHYKRIAGIGILLLVIILFLFPDMPLFARDVPYKEVLKSLLLIDVYDNNERFIGQGTGFLLDSSGGVVTNYHVIRDADFVSIKGADGQAYKVTGVLALDRDSDLVILSTDIPEGKVISPISNTSLAIGDPAWIVGMRSDRVFGAEGKISGFAWLPIIGDAFQVALAASPGMSGSPVINRNGKVIGVLTAQSSNGYIRNFAVPSVKLLRLMRLADSNRHSLSVNNKCAKDNDIEGLTVMHKAVRECDVKLINSLISEGFDLNRRERLHNMTPLHIAMKGSNIAIARLLLEHGADANLADYDGYTAIGYYEITPDTGSNELDADVWLRNDANNYYIFYSTPTRDPNLPIIEYAVAFDQVEGGITDVAENQWDMYDPTDAIDTHGTWAFGISGSGEIVDFTEAYHPD